MNKDKMIAAGLLKMTLGILGLVATVGSLGCQVKTGGQILPSPYYIWDDVQYYAPGPEFRLSEEAAAMERFREEAGP